MDIKQYIDYFDDIAHLDRSEQFTLLEQAKQQVSQRFKFPILSVLPVALRLICLILCCAGAYITLGELHWGLAIAAVVGLLLSRVISTEVIDKLLSNALKTLI